jgi:hypothetical protein
MDAAGSLCRGSLAYGYVVPGFGDDAADCQARFRSCDPVSGGYLGFDGARHQCR